MSTVAKIFIILNFILAAVLLGSAAAFLGHHDNWKVKFDKKVIELNQQLDEKQKLLLEKNAELTKTQGSLSQATDERNVSNEKASQLQMAYEQMKGSYDALNANLANMSKALQVAQTTIQNGRTLVDQLQQERQTLVDNFTKAAEEKNSALKMQNQLQLNLEQLSAQLQDTQSKLNSSDVELKRVTFAYNAIIKANPSIKSDIEQPSLTGKVLAADNAENIVVISLGAEDGVKEGFRYTLSRGTNYVATIQITNVQAKQAAGKVMSGMSKSAVAPGDDVMNAR
jgi:predicted  nucleic acid-binding Zn-ribbon protein